MEKLRFYLAHPFDDREWIREWESETEKELGIELLNPFYDSERADIVDIDAGRSERYDVDPRFIIEHDVGIILCSDGIVAFVTGSFSIGTIMEIVYARSLGKPVYLIVTNKQDGHPWLQYHATKIFKSTTAFVGYMKRRFEKKEK